MSDLHNLELRSYLLEVKPYLNMSAIARKVGLSKQVISMFLKDEHHLHTISVDTLLQIKQFIKNL